MGALAGGLNEGLSKQIIFEFRVEKQACIRGSKLLEERITYTKA